MLGENSITQSAYNGIVSQFAAEGAVEYALLKTKHHEEGFSDSITWQQDTEASLYGATSDLHKTPSLEYTTLSNYQDYLTSLGAPVRTPYTRTIAAYGFDIIPLFVDQGTLLQSGQSAKHPNTNTSDVVKTEHIHLFVKE